MFCTSSVSSTNSFHLVILFTLTSHALARLPHLVYFFLTSLRYTHLSLPCHDSNIKNHVESSIGPSLLASKSEDTEGCAVCHHIHSNLQTGADLNSENRKLSTFFSDKTLSDVIVKFGDQEIFAHRLILVKSSVWFETALLGEFKASQHVRLVGCHR